jgi:hypothetical protein
VEQIDLVAAMVDMAVVLVGVVVDQVLVVDAQVVLGVVTEVR